MAKQSKEWLVGKLMFRRRNYISWERDISFWKTTKEMKLSKTEYATITLITLIFEIINNERNGDKHC